MCRAYTLLDKIPLLPDGSEKPHANATVFSLTRVEVLTESMTSSWKICQQRTIEQMNSRFGDPTVSSAIPVFLDPRTAPYARVIIDNDDTYNSAYDTVMSEHRAVYRAIDEAKRNTGPSSSSGDVSRRSVRAVISATTLGPLDIPLFDQCEATGGENSDVDLDAEADEIFLKWLKVAQSIKWESYKHPGFEHIVCKGISDLYQFADPLKWFKETGRTLFPSIAHLARVHLSRIDNGAFQESVFSSAKGSMDKHQTKMSSEHHEKRAVLFHNRNYISQNIHFNKD